MIQADVSVRAQEGRSGRGYYVGRFGWQSEYGKPPATKAVEAELEVDGEKWSLLQNGLFGGDLSKLMEVKAMIDERGSRISFG